MFPRVTYLGLCVLLSPQEQFPHVDIDRAHSHLRHVTQLMAAYKPDRVQDKESKQVELRDAHKKLRDLTESLARLERDLVADFKNRLAGTPKPVEVNWKVASRHKGFVPEIPANIIISRQEERTRIRKNGGPESLHLCPNTPLKGDFRLVIRFSLAVKGSRGGTPVPYLGLRDAFGNEQVLVLLDSSPDPKKEEELLVERQQGKLMVVFNGDVQDLHNPTSPGGGDLYPFFLMNDVSEIELRDLRVGP